MPVRIPRHIELFVDTPLSSCVCALSLEELGESRQHLHLVVKLLCKISQHVLGRLADDEADSRVLY